MNLNSVNLIQVKQSLTECIWN